MPGRGSSGGAVPLSGDVRGRYVKGQALVDMSAGLSMFRLSTFFDAILDRAP